MAKVTLVFAVLAGCSWAGGLFRHGQRAPHGADSDVVWPGAGRRRFLAISPNESRRKLFMHVNVTIGLLGFLGARVEGGARLWHCAFGGHRSGHDCTGRKADAWPGCC